MLDFEDLRPPAPLPRLQVREPAEPATLEKTRENTDTRFLATWWAQRPGGNWYWRADVPARHLPGIVRGLEHRDLERTGPNTVVMPRQRGETAIWCYPGNASRGVLMRSLQLAGFRVLVEVDDDYLIGPPMVPNGSTEWKRRINPHEDIYSYEAHARIAEFADGIIVTTERLAQAYRDVNDHVYVCRNSVDPQDWPEPEKPNDGIFRIGYSASHSHWFDANEVTRALSWAAAQPGVEVVIFGLKRDWQFPVTQVPWTRDLAEYRRSLSVLDVGVCPLRPGPWADCKSDVKAMEYAMAGSAAIVSRTEPYREWHDQPFALTADTPKDFLRHVKWLVANQDAARELAANALNYVTENRFITQEIPKWRAACASPS